MNNPIFPYRWNLKNGFPKENNGLNVFATFLCGGGSSMGYKLAGYNHLGGVEIDSKIANLYQSNLSPKYLYVEDIKEFIKREPIPDELYQLDILDGSPPCSSFSLAGKREKNWGKNKKFREGQAKQVLDTLFFDFIDLANKLSPKVIVAENVRGLTFGNAKNYCRKIINKLEEIGYQTQIFSLNSASMGVPQKRQRVFFISRRKDLRLPDLELNFNQKPIKYGQIRIPYDEDRQMTDYDKKIWSKRISTDKKYSDVLMRAENRYSNFNSCFVKDEEVVPTITSTNGSKLISFSQRKHLSNTELILASTFPLDYDFKQQNVKYVVGMSVPPVMMANISMEVYSQWFKKQ